MLRAFAANIREPYAGVARIKADQLRWKLADGEAPGERECQERARVLVELGAFDLALQWTRLAVARSENPLRSHDRWEIAWCLEMNGNYAEALADYEAVGKDLSGPFGMGPLHIARHCELLRQRIAQPEDVKVGLEFVLSHISDSSLGFGTGLGRRLEALGSSIRCSRPPASWRSAARFMRCSSTF